MDINKVKCVDVIMHKKRERRFGFKLFPALKSLSSYLDSVHTNTIIF